MPYVMGNYIELYRFLKKQQETYQFYDRVWVQHIDRINQCTAFTFQRIELDYCERLSPFICEMGTYYSFYAFQFYLYMYIIIYLWS